MGEVQDHHDIAHVALRRRRDVGIPAIKIIAVHTATGRSPFGDRFRIARLRYVIDAKPAAEVGGPALADLS
jgi:hypothetical protein